MIVFHHFRGFHSSYIGAERNAAKLTVYLFFYQFFLKYKNRSGLERWTDPFCLALLYASTSYINPGVSMMYNVTFTKKKKKLAEVKTKHVAIVICDRPNTCPISRVTRVPLCIHKHICRSMHKTRRSEYSPIRWRVSRAFHCLTARYFCSLDRKHVATPHVASLITFRRVFIYYSYFSPEDI